MESRLLLCLLLLLPGPAPAQAPLDALPTTHWSRRLLAELRFPAGEPLPAPLETRLDAAIHLGRWLERGLETPEARPRLLAAEYRRELQTLGLPAEKIRRLLAKRTAHTVDLTRGPRYSALQERTQSLLSRSLREHGELERRIRALESARRVAARR